MLLCLQRARQATSALGLRRPIFLKGKGRQGLVDKIKIKVVGGRGGHGVNAFQKLRNNHKIPTGGSGGNGGNVFFETFSGISDLKLGQGVFRASDGSHGAGDDRVISVPQGTIVTRLHDMYSYFTLSLNRTLCDSQIDLPPHIGEPVDLLENGELLLVARGGLRGRGNHSLRVKDPFDSNSEAPAPHHVLGAVGDEIVYQLELKTIADVGLLGPPNVGKSSLLAALSSSRPHIADYPFTTLIPIVGKVPFNDFSSITIADVPGLVPGAHENRGLGIEFLRHLQRTRVLLVVLDAAHSHDLFQDFLYLDEEIRQFDPLLAEKPRIIAANKIDLGMVVEEEVDRVALEEKTGCRVFFISTKMPSTLGPLALHLRETVRDPSR